MSVCASASSAVHLISIGCENMFMLFCKSEWYKIRLLQAEDCSILSLFFQRFIIRAVGVNVFK